MQLEAPKSLSRRPRRVEGTGGTSPYGDGTSGPIGSPGRPGLASAPGQECQGFSSQTGFLARPPSGDSSSSPSPPSQAENCAAPLRARGPTRPLRAGSEFQGGGAETAGAAAAAAGPGSAVARAAPPCGGPARIRPLPGRCSPWPRDEPGERGGPPAPPALRVSTDGEPGSDDLCSPGLCDLGRPCTLSGPKSGRTGRAGGGHPESRQHTLAWVLGRLLGGGAWPRPADCLITHGISNRAPAPWAQVPPTIALCDLDGVLTFSAPQFSYL